LCSTTLDLSTDRLTFTRQWVEEFSYSTCTNCRAFTTTSLRVEPLCCVALNITTGNFTPASLLVELKWESTKNVTTGRLTLACQWIELQRRIALDIATGQFTLTSVWIQSKVSATLDIPTLRLTATGQWIQLLVQGTLNISTGRLALTSEGIKLLPSRACDEAIHTSTSAGVRIDALSFGTLLLFTRGAFAQVPVEMKKLRTSPEVTVFLQWAINLFEGLYDFSKGLSSLYRKVIEHTHDTFMVNICMNYYRLSVTFYCNRSMFSTFLPLYYNYVPTHVRYMQISVPKMVI